MRIEDLALKHGFTKQKKVSGSDSLWKKETKDEILSILQYASTYVFLSGSGYPSKNTFELDSESKEFKTLEELDTYLNIRTPFVLEERFVVLKVKVYHDKNKPITEQQLIDLWTELEDYEIKIL